MRRGRGDADGVRRLLALGAALLCLVPAAGLARPLTEVELTVVGIELDVDPATQSVPKGVTSAVRTHLTVPQVSLPVEVLQKLLPQNLTVKGELSGPAFATPIALSAPAGTPLTLPTLPLLGTYTLRNLRLVAGTEDLIAASPSVVTIQAIDDVLVTRVVTRPLSLDEIQARGIAIDRTNFTVLNFTAVVGTQSNRVNIDFPVILPKQPSGGGDGGPLAPEPPAVSLPPIPSAPNLVAKPVVFVPVLPSLEGLLEDVELPPIPALLVFPGNIGFLHQFFQALLIVTNGAPDGSSLVVQDLVAAIQLPAGEDKVAGTDESPGDDPLRVARLEGQGFVHSLPVRAAGPDGQFGTADDTGVLTSGMTGRADFSVEGLKEGVHEVQFDIQGTLLGLPRGPVTIQGRARGAVLVRNPNFALTLSHPNVVRRGEAYDLFATLTNTSQVDANLVSISLDPRGVSGAQLLSDSRVEFRTIPAGESATATFHLQAQRTGVVTATAVQSDEGILGRFSLRAGVGELGIPLSPDTLVIPTFGNTLPADLTEAAMGLLGQAYSVATAPEGALPPGVARIPRDTVTRMATGLSEAGLRIRLGEPALRSVEELLLDLAGSDLADPAFDDLRRRSSQGAKVAAAAAAVLGAGAATQGLLDFQQALAGDLTSRTPHLSVAAGGLRVRITDDGGGSLGTLAAGGAAARGIAYGERLVLRADPAGPGSGSTLDVVARLEAGRYTVEAVAAAAGSVDLGIVFPRPAAGGQAAVLEQVRFAGVPVQEGSTFKLVLLRDAANTYALAIDDDGDGRPDRTLPPASVAAIPDRGPQVVNVVQIVDQFPPQRDSRGVTQQLSDRFGRLVGILFSERVDAASAAAPANYQVEGNAVTQVLLQPSGRLVALMLQNSVGPFVPRRLTVSGLRDARGNPMTPAADTRPITMAIGDDGGVLSGTVRAADGTPLAGAAVAVQQQTEDELFGFPITQTVSQVATDGQGRYQVDFVLGSTPFTLTAAAPGGQDSASVTSTLTERGQRLNVDLVMLGRGQVAGAVRGVDGTPQANAVVTLQAVGSLERFGARAAGDGSFRFDRVPVGGFTVTAFDAAGNRGYAAGTLAAAGSTARADVTILPPLATVSVSGQVFRADGVTPIPGVPVVLTATPTAGGGFTTFVTTDATSSFRFANLPAGTLALRAYDPATGEAGTATVSLGPGQSESVAIVFSGLGAIQGQVLTAGGAPVPFANVVAGPTLAQADAAGRFTIGNLPVGSHLVRGQDPVTGVIGQATATLLTAGQTAQVTVVLPASGTITGRVFAAEDGAPLADASVRIVTSGGYMPATLDAAALYRFETLRLGSYQLAAIRGNAVATATVTLAADGQVVRKDFTLPTRVTTGAVTGTVTDAGSNNQPVAATVSLAAQAIGALGLPEIRPFASVISDAFTGRFTFTNVPTGPVQITARSVLRPNPATASGALAEGQTLDFALVLTANIGSLSGTVLGTDGSPAGAGILVSVQNNQVPVVTVSTGDNGRFAFAPILPQGAYTLTAEDPLTGFKGQVQVSVAGGRDVQANVRLLGKGSVLVTVREASGAPVLDGTVEMAGGTFLQDRASGILTPAGNGQVRFANITEGPFSVTARDVGGLKGLANGTIPGAGAEAAVTITLQPAGTIAGRFLRPDGSGVPNAQITLTDAGGNPRAFTATSGDPGDEGRFTFATVPVGSYGLQGLDPATGRRGATGARVDRDGQVVTADFATVSLGTVSGVVRSGDGTTAVAGADVRLSPSGLFSQPAFTQSGPDGGFTFPGVSAGGFQIQVTDPATTLAGAAKGSLSLEGETVTVTVLLEPSGTVQGRVLRADGSTSLANAQVSLVRPGTQFRRSLQSEADGRFTFTYVPIGDVTLGAASPAGIDVAAGSGRLGAEGDVLSVDLTMVGTGVLAGKVLDSNGVDPVPNAVVTARSLGANPVTFTAGTAEDGTFRFDPFPVGAVSLSARSVGGLGAAGSAGIAADGASASVTLVLEASGSVAGLALLPDGATPARGAVVTLKSPRLTIATHTQGDGRFLFEAIPLATFHLDLVDPVGGGIQLADGGLTANGQTVDVGTLTLDDRAVAVTAVSPVDGAVDVGVGSRVTVTFSERVLRGSVTAASVRVLGEGAALGGSLGFAANDTQVIFTPAQALKGSRRYTVQVTPQVTDLVGHPLLAERVTSFTTVDNVPPQVTGISPAANAIQVPPEAVVRVTFSEALDPASVGADAITVAGPGGPVAGRVDPILNNTALVFTPNAPLAPNSRYTVALGAVRDPAGNPLPAQPAQTFTTVDTIPPTVTGLSLPAGARTVQGGTVTVTATTADADVRLVDVFADGALAGTASVAPYTVPVVLLPRLTAGQVVVTAVAEDRVGNRGPAASLTIPVAPPPPPAALRTLDAASATVRQTLNLTFTVEIAPEQPTETVVALASSIPARLSVPATLTLPPYTTRASFTAKGLAQGPVTVTASVNGTQAQAAVTVQVPPAAVAGLSPAAQTIFRAEGGTLTVSIAPPQPDDTVVSLASSNAAVAGVPTSVTIPASATTADVAVAGVAKGTATIAASANGTSAQAAVTVRIRSGIVTGTARRESGATVAGLTVQIAGSGGTLTAVTDGAGRFTFPEVPIGTVTLTAFDAAGNAFGTAQATVTLDQTSAADLTLLVGGTVAGRVTNAGAPVAGAQVTLTAGGGTATATTGADGRYQVDRVAPGAVTVVVRDPLSGLRGRAAGALIFSGTTLTLDVGLSASGTVTGTVLWAGGTAPAPGVQVTINRPLPGLPGTVATDAAGRFLFDFVPLGAFTLDATDQTVGDRGRATAQLGATGETRDVTITLNGLGQVVVTVRDAGENLVAGAQVTLTSTTQFGGTQSGTTAPDATATFPRVLAGGFNLSATDPATRLIGSGSGTVGAGGAAAVTVHLQPAGTIQGLVLGADGATPVAGAAVSLAAAGRQASSAADGSFRFDAVPLGTYTLEARDGAGRLRARETGIALAAHGDVAARNLTFIALGSVTGLVRNPDGTAAASAPVGLSSPHPVLGGAFAATAGADGRYRFAAVPAGPFTVTARDAAGQFTGDAAGTIEQDGQEVTADIQLFPPINLPATRYDANAFPFDIQGDGSAARGLFGAFQGALSLEVVAGGTSIPFPGVTVGVSEQGGRQVAIRQHGVAGLDVTRKVFVPREGYFARSLEILTNPGPAPVTVDLRVVSNIQPLDGPPRVVATSGGRATLDVADAANPDRWAVIDDNSDGDPFGGTTRPAVAFVFDGAGAAQRAAAAAFTAASSGAGQLAYRWNGITVPPGGTAAFLHFTVQQTGRAAAEAAAARLAQLPPEALTGLSAEELAALRNFAPPPGGVSAVAPLPSLQGTVTGRVLAGDGGTPVPSASVRFRSTNILFGRTWRAVSDGTGSFSLVGALNDTGTSLPIPVDTFTLGATDPVTGVAAPAAAGTFTSGQTAAVQDVVFTGTGLVRGVVRRHTGAPAAGGYVTISGSGSGVGGTVNIGAGGGYLITGLPPGSYTLSATVPHPQGWPLTGSAGATVTAGQATATDIAIQPTGAAAGTVRNGAGAPASNVFVRLAAGFFAWSTRTDGTGRYLLSDIPVASYTVSATEPISGVLTTAPVAVAQDQTASQDLALIGLGTVTVQVNLVGGGPASAAPVSILEAARGYFRSAGSTDAAGRLTIPNVTAGTFTVRAQHPTLPGFFTDVAGTLARDGDVVPVTVVVGGGTVTGLVTFARGAAAPNVTIQVSGPAVTTQSALTDTNGRYTFGQVQAGQTFSVRALHPADAAVFRDAPNNIIAAPGATLTVNLTLPALATVRVTVLLGGAPFAGARIEIQDSVRLFFRTMGTTDATGVLSIPNVPEGAFTVRATDPATSAILGTPTGTVGTADDGQTLNVAINAASLTGTVQGTVFAADGERPLGFTVVEIYDVQSGQLRATPQADSRGFYRASGVQAGPLGFRVRAYIQYPYRGYGGFVDVTGAFTAYGQTVTADVVLPVSVVKGTVLYSDGVTPVPNPYVYINQPGVFGYSITSDDQGHYTIVGAAAVGPFTLMAQDPASGLSATVATTLPDSLVLALNVLMPPTGTVRGAILDAAGRGVPSADVALSSSALPGFTRIGRADEQGAYIFDRIPLGAFSVQARDPASGILGLASGQLAQEGQTVTVDVRLPATGTVAGTVFGLGGVTPVPNAVLTIETFDNSGPLGHFRTNATADAAGGYQAAGVPVGTVRVTAFDPVDSSLAGLTEGPLGPGATATINVTLAPQFVNLPYSLQGSDWFPYDVQCTGGLGSGNGAYFGAYELAVNYSSTPCVSTGRLEADPLGNGQEIAIGPFNANALRVTRKIFVPAAGGFARYLEILANPTGAPVSADVTVTSFLASGGTTRILMPGPDGASSGYLVTDSGDACGGPACGLTLAHVFAGEYLGPGPAPWVQFQDGDGFISYNWSVVVPPGGTVILMHFAVQAWASWEAEGRAQALTSLTDPDALVGMTPAERSQVVNFLIP